MRGGPQREDAFSSFLREPAVPGSTTWIIEYLTGSCHGHPCFPSKYKVQKQRKRKWQSPWAKNLKRRHQPLRVKPKFLGKRPPWSNIPLSRVISKCSERVQSKVTACSTGYCSLQGHADNGVIAGPDLHIQNAPNVVSVVISNEG